MNKLKVLILLVVILSGCSLTPALVYTEVKPQRGDVQDVIATVGVVEPQNRLEIIPPISGRIDSILVREGDLVRTGQVLAQLSSTERSALLDAARAQGPQAVKYWEEAYKTTPLIAPINGMVIVRSVEPGQTVNTNTPVIVLADRLIIKAQVDETDIGKVVIGQQVTIALDAYPDVKILGRVAHISYESKTVNNVTVYEVEIIPNQVPGIFRSGMSADVQITRASRKNVLLVPAKALTWKGTQATVQLQNNPTPVTVTVGLNKDELVEIQSGLKDTDLLLISSGNATSKKRSSTFIGQPGNRARH